MKKSQFVKLLKETVKNSINEISSDLFKRASTKSMVMGQPERRDRMANTFFSKFIGKPLMQSEITSISNDAGELNINIEGTFDNENRKINRASAKYDMNLDRYEVILPKKMQGLTRVDARILQLIAQKANPNTKYKNGIQDLPVVGY